MNKSLLIIILLTATHNLLYGQTAATNTGTLYISGSSDIFCAVSDFSNHAGSALTNNGQLHVKGQLINDQSSMVTGTGTLYLDGTSSQIVAGSQLFKTYNLNTNNSAGITLNNDLSVSNAHTFTAGVITTSSTPNYLIYESGSSYSGDGDPNHVNGWIKKFGSANFVFPVGNGTVERTVALNSLSASSEFNVMYLSTTPNTSQMQVPIWNVDPAEYWSIQKISGGTASVAMNWDFSKVYFPNYIISDIRAVGYNGSLWTNNGGSATGSAATTGNITSNNISSFNLFTFGSVSYILPLTLINFNAVRQAGYTQISWTTDRELNIDHFIVERSDNGISFFSVSQMAARNSGFTEQYTTRDNAPIGHAAYYRLRLIDVNGRESLSKTIVVTAVADNRLTLLVNPVHDKAILVASPSFSGSFLYTINAMNGKLVQQGTLAIQNGGQYPIALKPGLGAGIYVLEIRDEQQDFRFRIMVQ